MHSHCDLTKIARSTSQPQIHVMKQIDTIQNYHAHVYFDETSFDQAHTLCWDASKFFGVEMGTMIRRPVGPHPMPSCQLQATPAQFAKLLPWLALNRNGLIVFAHPQTDDDLQDHRDHGIWLGTGLDLNLEIFNGLQTAH